MLTIDRSIPIPPITRYTRGSAGCLKRLYPLDEMGVGDSVFAPGREIRSVTSVCDRDYRKTGRQWTCRTVTENGQRGVRVWRTR